MGFTNFSNASSTDLLAGHSYNKELPQFPSGPVLPSGPSAQQERTNSQDSDVNPSEGMVVAPKRHRITHALDIFSPRRKSALLAKRRSSQGTPQKSTPVRSGTSNTLRTMPSLLSLSSFIRDTPSSLSSPTDSEFAVESNSLITPHSKDSDHPSDLMFSPKLRLMGFESK